jgi:hypothetical protein
LNLTNTALSWHDMIELSFFLTQPCNNWSWDFLF